MKSTLHGSQTRGQAHHGWLDSHFSFSFANYFDRERMGFGKLRVLNDDVIQAGRGFDMHPHDNMEIVTIPFAGGLRHKDSEGNSELLRPGEVQVMSAGTGIWHSEFSKAEDAQGQPEERATELLQIWVLPDREGHAPRYERKAFDGAARKNQWQTIVAPRDSEAARSGSADGPLWIHQEAHFSLASLEEGVILDYELHGSDHGVYAFLIDGAVEIAGDELVARDAIGVWDTAQLSVRARKASEVLLIEVPLS